MHEATHLLKEERLPAARLAQRIRTPLVSAFNARTDNSYCLERATGHDWFWGNRSSVPPAVCGAQVLALAAAVAAAEAAAACLALSRLWLSLGDHGDSSSLTRNLYLSLTVGASCFLFYALLNSWAFISFSFLSIGSFTYVPWRLFWL